MGFHPCLWITTAGIGTREGYSALMLHADRAMYATGAYVRVGINNRAAMKKSPFQ